MRPVGTRKQPKARNVYVEENGKRDGPRWWGRKQRAGIRDAEGKEEEKRPRRTSLPSRAWAWAVGRLAGVGWLKSFGIVTLLLTVATGAVAAVCLCSLWLYNAAVTSDFFTTRHVDVTGNVRLPREMVLEYGGIREGENSLAVSITQAERRLLDTPWVEEVSVKRLLPDRFVIRIKERMPSFWVHQDGVLYYANEFGEIIAPVESENFLSLPTLKIEQGADDDVPFLTQLLRDLRGGKLPVEIGVMASVTVSLGKGIEMYLEDRDMRLSVATDDWEGNLRRLGVTLGDLAERQELKNVREVRAVSGEVWVVLRQVGQS